MVNDKKKIDKAPIVNENERMIKTSAKPQVSDLIGQRLRNYYEEVANEPIPDRFMDLLNQLDAARAAKKPE